MTNAELLAKIKAEIERLRSNMDDRDPLAPNQKAGYLFALADVLSFLSTLESENPVPADLEEAAEKCIDDALFKWSYDDEDGIEQYVHDAFIAGAKWQKQHDAELIEIAYNDGITIGITKQKEQMMKEAVAEVEVGMRGDPIEIILDKYVQRAMGIFPGDKVLVIICKKED